jgi:hypothetical protein
VVAALVLAFAAGRGVVSAQEAHVAVIVGLAGDPEFAELYGKWGASLVDAATTRYGIPKDHVLYLNEKPDADAKRATGRSTRDEIVKAFDRLAAAGADDVVFVVLIGHGSFDGRNAKFNLKGPDLSAADFSALLRKLPSKHIVFANTTSASGPFKEELAGPGRTIITATRNGAEQYATLFPGYFVDAFATDTADADKNRRVTVQEAFDYATREVARAYEREGLLATEHAVIDDGGKLASAFALGTAGADPLPADPKVRALYVERREMERRVEALKLLKDSMDPARYSSELEKLVTDIALKTREIRAAEAK